MGTRILNFFDGFTSNTTPATLGVTGSVASPTAITAAGGITPSGFSEEMMYIAGSGGAIDITANPQIVAGTIDGQILKLYGTSDVNTVTLEDGNGLELRGSVLLGANDFIELQWNLTSWAETSRNN